MTLAGPSIGLTGMLKICNLTLHITQIYISKCQVFSVISSNYRQSFASFWDDGPLHTSWRASFIGWRCIFEHVLWITGAWGYQWAKQDCCPLGALIPVWQTNSQQQADQPGDYKEYQKVAGASAKENMKPQRGDRQNEGMLLSLRENDA